MGILGHIKEYIPFIVYLIGLVFVLMGFIGKGKWTLLLITFLVPLRNVIDKLQELPGGGQLIDFLIFSALISWFVSVMQNKTSLLAPSSLNFVIVILVLYTFLTLILGNDYLYGTFAIDFSNERVKDWKNFCLMPLLFLITLNLIKDRKWIIRILLAMGLAMILMGYYTATQITWYSSLLSRSKITGTFQFLGPNEVAAFFNQYTVILISIFFFLKHKRLKLGLMALICLNIFCIIFLYSRGAYVGLFIGMGFLFLFKNKKFIIPLILVAALWQTILPEKAIERIKGTTNELGQLDESSARRIVIWEQAADLFKKNPVTGIGFGVFRYLGLDLGDTHNIYLKILVEQGILGMIVFLSIILSFLRMGWVLFKKGEDDLGKSMGLGLLACMIVLIINNSFGDRWAYFELSAYLWIYAGLVGRYIIISKTPTIEITTAPTTITEKSKALYPHIKPKKKIRYYDL